MAVSYGPAINTSTNGARVGLELRVTGSGASRTVHWEIWLWTKRASFGSASYSVSGATSSSGSSSYSHSNNSSDWPTSNRTRLASGSFTRSLNYGSSQTVSISGAVSSISAVPGTASHSRSITLPARGIEPPYTPQNVSVSRVSDARATVSWTRNNPNLDRQPYYQQRIQRRFRLDVPGNPWSSWSTRATLTGSPSSYSDETAANWAYQWRVQARNTAGDSGWATTGEYRTTPAAPSNLRAQSSTAGIRVSWSNQARFPVGTEVQRQEGAGAWVEFRVRAPGATDATLADPDLTVTHRFRARAVGTGTPALNSSWVYSNVVELAAPPAAPTGLGPSSAWDATEARTLTWRYVPTDGSQQERFQIRHRLAGGAWVTVPAVDAEVSAWTLPASTYTNGDTVEWQVRTWGPHPDAGPWSQTAITSPVARPTVAINTPEEGETIDRSSVQVAWGYDDEAGGSQAGWRLTLERDGQEVQSLSGSGATSSRVLSGLADDTIYTLRMAVRGGSGLWSVDDEVTFAVSYLPPQAPTIEVSWDVELGAAVVGIEHPPWGEDSAEPSHAQLWRAIDDGPWLLIADEIPLDTSVTDPIPAIGDGTVNYYRARAVSVLPSTADSAVVPLAVALRDTRGWVYLNAGPGMSQVCRVRGNATRGDSEGVGKGLRTYRGRPSPVLRSGTARSLQWQVSARLAPNFDGASTRAELVDLQALDGAVCYRDPVPEAPARWFGAMHEPDFSWERILGDVSWSMTQVDYAEGLAVEESEDE